MTKTKKQVTKDNQNKLAIEDIQDDIQVVQYLLKWKAEQLLNTLTTLLQVADGLKNYYYLKDEMEMPFKFRDVFEENRKNITLMNLDRLQFDDPFIYDRNLKSVLDNKMTDKDTLMQLCATCLLWYKHLLDTSNATKHIPILNILQAEHFLTKYSHETIGYWMRKLEELRKNEKSNDTKKQQQAIKEKYVTETYIKLINNPADKKALANLSQNKIARRIQEIVIPNLQDKKTATGAYVLTRKVDRDKIKYSGLDTDTIIAIMRKQDKFTFNPFKNTTSK